MYICNLYCFWFIHWLQRCPVYTVSETKIPLILSKWFCFFSTNLFLLYISSKFLSIFFCFFLIFVCFVFYEFHNSVNSSCLLFLFLLSFEKKLVYFMKRFCFWWRNFLQKFQTALLFQYNYCKVIAKNKVCGTLHVGKYCFWMLCIDTIFSNPFFVPL